jgi:hypothetical protein
MPYFKNINSALQARNPFGPIRFFLYHQRMKAGDHYWWNKERGVKYKVEIVSTQFATFPKQLTENISSSSVIVRVLAGVHRGMFSVVESKDLSPFE